jgi:hypothetical protein
LSATIIPPEILARRREEREERRREREVFRGSILGLLDDEPEQPVCGVASEPIGGTAKWLKQILTP